MKINTISTIDSQFPSQLRAIPSPPEKLYYRGTLDLSSSLAVSIVGTRKPTRYGIEVTTRLAEALASRGAVIVSGLALGVDALAHQGALNVGGKTIAVLAGGVDDPSPRTNSQLAERIVASGGALVSEYKPGTAPYKDQFLARNRIVSGLGNIIIVTEAGLRSGTANTVSHALAQGRDVYAVPGSITSPMSAGANQLISQGAQPIVSIDEFVEQLIPSTSVNPSVFADDPSEAAILKLVQSGVRDGDELQQKSQLEAGDFAQAMTMLEIKGLIKPLGANHWSL